MTAQKAKAHTGTWAGPGLLALIDGEWVHFYEREAPRDLRARATALVGLDRPTITIRLAQEKPRPHEQGPEDPPSVG